MQDPAHFTGTVTTGVAFIRGTFRLSIEYRELDRPARIVAQVHGSGLGIGLDASVVITFLPSDGGTTVRWSRELTFSGPVASVGERILRTTVDKKTHSLFDRAREQLEAESAGG